MFENQQLLILGSMKIGCEIVSEITSTIKIDLINYWTQNRILNEEKARKRCEEVVIIARSEDNTIVGVMTALNQFIPMLKNYCYVMRFSINAQHNDSFLPIKIGRLAYVELEQKAKLERNSPIGLFAVIQNTKMKLLWNYAVWPKMPFVYIGDTPEGHQRRVLFFQQTQIAIPI